MKKLKSKNALFRIILFHLLRFKKIGLSDGLLMSDVHLLCTRQFVNKLIGRRHQPSSFPLLIINGVYASLFILSFVSSETRSWQEVSMKIFFPRPSRKSSCFTWDEDERSWCFVLYRCNLTSDLVEKPSFLNILVECALLTW